MALSAFFSIVQSSIFRSQGHEIAPPEDSFPAAPFFSVPFFTVSVHRSVALFACIPTMHRFSPLPSMACPFRSKVSWVGVFFLLFIEI